MMSNVNAGPLVAPRPPPLVPPPPPPAAGASPPTPPPSRRLLGGVLMWLAAVSLGCSGSIAAPADSPVSVRTSQLFLTLENLAGQPLTDVTVAIVPIGGHTDFTKFYGRIESAEKRNISLGDFS